MRSSSAGSREWRESPGIQPFCVACTSAGRVFVQPWWRHATLCPVSASPLPLGTERRGCGSWSSDRPDVWSSCVSDVLWPCYGLTAPMRLHTPSLGCPSGCGSPDVDTGSASCSRDGVADDPRKCSQVGCPSPGHSSADEVRIAAFEAQSRPEFASVAVDRHGHA